VVFAVNAAMMLAANIVFRRVSRRRHPSFSLGVGIAVTATGGALMVLVAAAAWPGWSVWAAAVLFTGGMGLVLPSAHSWGQVTLVASGAASALTGSSQFLGGVLGSPVTGAIGPTAVHLGIIIAASSAVGIVAWNAGRLARRAGTSEATSPRGGSAR
jgi:MFS transporter, DHA1 family, multidrug resistance protein